jgi:crotonobetainyl-CoA:carnitine CoA-transferase CaiB-like acyl-CoA transferase
MGDDELWLEDVRVLDMSLLLPGPFCTMLLGDMGADVLKIERPEGGDQSRMYPPRVEGTSTFFAGLNRNKRSIGLDLKSDRGTEILEGLVEEADVLVESFRPGVLERLGVGHEHLQSVNPELITCAITGYGADGPLANRAGHDLNYEARSGLLYQNRGADQAPVVPGAQVADIAGGGLYAALSIVGALYRRERTGGGEFLDISMTEGAMSLHIPQQAAAGAGEAPEPGGDLLSGGAPSYNVYETADGEYMAVSALEPKFWGQLLDLLDAQELAAEGLDTGESGEEAREQLADIFAEKTREEWVELFDGEEVCVEPVKSPAELIEDELFRAREVFFELAGVRHARTPVTPPEREHTAPPELGEHTDEVLGELGYEEATIEEMREDGVV